jgi:hypothetical protein
MHIPSSWPGAIHVFADWGGKEDVDARHKAGHDGN